MLSLFSSHIISKQKKVITDIQESYKKLKLNFDSLKKTYETLKEENDILRNKNDVLKKESSSLSSQMQEAEVEIEKTIDKFEDFEIKVKESMEWFTTNSNIKNANNSEKIRNRLKDRCMDIETDPTVCEIDLHCIYRTNVGNFINYVSDEKKVNKSDFLQSVDLMIKNMGGDCEDFSLLYKAEFNYLIEQCLSAGYDRNQIISSFGLYGDRIISGTYMYPICGFFDPERKSYNLGGHCVVALTNEPILKTSGIYPVLKNAQLVEPQSGEYMFDMNDTEIIYLFDDGEQPDTLYHVSDVIVENDLKIFYKWSEEIEWIGYSDFLKDIQLSKKKLMSD